MDSDPNQTLLYAQIAADVENYLWNRGIDDGALSTKAAAHLARLDRVNPRVNPTLHELARLLCRTSIDHVSARYLKRDLVEQKLREVMYDLYTGIKEEQRAIARAQEREATGAH